jgi:hypothetical protein
MQIVRLADMLPGGHEQAYGFSCECGCGEIVSITADEYARDGAWLDGHDPTHAQPAQC